MQGEYFLPKQHVHKSEEDAGIYIVLNNACIRISAVGLTQGVWYGVSPLFVT